MRKRINQFEIVEININVESLFFFNYFFVFRINRELSI